MRLRTTHQRQQSRRSPASWSARSPSWPSPPAPAAPRTRPTTRDSGGDRRRAAEGSNDEGVTPSPSASPRPPPTTAGWLPSPSNVRDLAEEYPDIDLQVAEGTNDVNLQISQVETFINDGVDAIVLLPFDGAAMTPVALKAMEAGITVINVDREFDDPNAARVTVLGDNYGMGVSAGAVHLRAGRRQRGRRSSPRSPASTRCR